MPVNSTQATNPMQATLVQRDPNRTVQQGSAVEGCKSTDATPAPTPGLRRAMCFDLGKSDAQIVPQPPPSNTGWSQRPRDPVLLELSNIEIGSHLEFISLSDNPEATFESDCVRRLDLTGYDVGNRIGTVVLNPAEMETKGFQPGERIVVRQVDKNGNASDGIFIHLDPNGWASQQVRQSDDAGNQVTLRGANIAFTDGMTGLSGASGAVRNVIGTAVRDVDGPKLLDKNLSLKTFQYSQDEYAVAEQLGRGETRNWVYSILRRTQFSLAEAKTLLARADITPKAKETLDKLLANNAAIFDKIDPAYDPANASKDGIIGDADFNQILSCGADRRDVYLRLDKALEPGSNFRLQNSRSGAVFTGTLGADQRVLSLRLSDMKDGDPLILTVRDGAGNDGKPFAMEYSSSCKDGKASYNPLSVRYGGASIGRP
ncbi:MAG: hypothetical protein HYS27_08595 [Deltaproteobacteria bacterium]|nr:hypothetical protein [Deltaproteobacteria bacterium]